MAQGLRSAFEVSFHTNLSYLKGMSKVDQAEGVGSRVTYGCQCEAF